MKLIRAARQRSHKLSAGVAVLAVFAIGFAFGNQSRVTIAQSGTTQPVGTEDLFAPFWQVYNLIQNDYIDPVEADVLVNGAISGMVDSLGDQFSGYIEPEVFPVLNDDLSGQIEGIGVVIRINDETDEIEIVNVLDGAPAQQAGIIQGDVFVSVGGESVTGFTQLELAGRVRGAAGTPVDITVRRGGEHIDFTIIRARLQIPNVETEILDGNLGYIKLTQFTSQARGEIDAALSELDADSLDGLILDLRGNPGGLLSSAIDVASAFIPEGTILIEDFGNGSEQTFRANGDFRNIDTPLVVLVDESSASASELVAGAWQDLERATIIGETTLGKGTVQTLQELANGGGVRLTIARWLTPERRWIHNNGIEPDIIVEWTPAGFDDPDDPQLDAAVSFLTGAALQVAVPAGQ